MRLLAFALAGLLLAGCAQQQPPSVIHVTVGDDYLEAFGDPQTRNGHVVAQRGDSLEFLASDGTHHLRIHHEDDPASSYLLDEDVPADGTLVLELERRGVHHVWCSIHGGLGTGMHLDVRVD